MGLLTRLGNEFIVVALPLVLLWLWSRRLRRQAAEVLIATVGAQLLNDALKLAFHRPRPSVFVSVIPGQMFSFPSGHAMVSVAFYGALAVIGWRVLRGRTRIAWLTAMTAVVVLVGVSRLFLDVHYPTDVLASWAGGLLWLDVSLALVRSVAVRRARMTQTPTSTMSSSVG
jgi:undecaprenyl-diphosphatase